MGKALSSHIRGLIEGDNCYSVNYVVWHFPASACDCAYVKVTSGTVPGAVATGSVAPGRYRSRYRTDCRTVYESENRHRKNAKQTLVNAVLNIFLSHIFSLWFCQQENVGQEDTPLSDCRIEHHSRPQARAGDGNDGASRVNFSDAMIGAVGDKQASVLRDGDLLRRVELGLQGLSAVAAETLAP